MRAGDSDGGKQPGSRSQKLELGKGHVASAAKKDPSASFFSRLSGGKSRFTRRVITLGKPKMNATIKRVFAFAWTCEL